MLVFPGHPNLPWYRSVGTMIGSVVGVGVFGLPYALSKSGYVLGLLELLAVGFLLLLLQLLYAEIVVQTPGKHRIAGYVKLYLGHPWDRVVTVLFAFSAWGAMVAYMLVGGGFLHTLLSPIFGGTLFWYQLGMAILAACLTFGGISKLAKMEAVVVGALLFLFAFMILAALPSIQFKNLLQGNVSQWFAPYGVVFFALSSLGVVPEMKEVLGKQIRKLPQAVVTGQTVIVLLYALFVFAVVGVPGSDTTERAFEGLATTLGPSFALIGSFLGSLTVLSVFSLMAAQLQGILRFDYGIPLRKAWLAAILVPVSLFLFGVRAFIELIGFTGAVFGGLLGLFILATYVRMRRSSVCQIHHCLTLPRILTWLIVAVIIGGIFETVWHLFKP